MSCCSFENATGLTSEADFTIASNLLYDEILINSNLVFNNSSNYTSNSSNYLFDYSSNNSNNLFNNIGGTSNDFKNFSNQIKGWINSNGDSNYIYFNNSNNTIINSNSELFVFHNSNVLIPFDETKYWSVEDKLTSNIIETNLIKFDFGLLQTAITTLTNFISTIQAEVSALEASDLVMAGSLVAIENQIQTINAILSELDISLNSLYPLEIVDKNIQLNYNTEQFNLISSNLNIKSITQNIPPNRATYTNGLLNIINDTTAYIKYIENGSITFPVNTSIDILLVGAGGNGGGGFYSGGGGAGEVIYKTSYTISAGTYSIQVGQSSIITNDRISKIYQGATNLILAKGGGDGGFFDKINDSIYNYFLYKSVVGRVNNVNDYNLIEGGNRIIFNKGYIEINGVKDKSYPLLSTSPIYWYKLDANAFLINSGVYGGAGDLTNTGAIIDTTNFIKGTSSVFFNSFNNASLTLNISLNLRTLQTTTGFSISLWTYLKSTNNTSSFIFNIDNGINRTRFLSLTKLYQYLQFEVQYDNNYQYLTNGDDVVNIFNNSWYFITLTFATNNDIKFYINNELKGTLNFIFPNTNLTRFSIGGLTNNYFDGNVDDFRFYTSCLTNDEIKELYNGSIVINSLATSGGSGGGSGDLSQSRGLKGTPFDGSSLINDGYDFVNDLDAFGNPDINYGGGNGGSALANGNGYTELITGNKIIVGKGGFGNTNDYYYPEPKNNYGDGGDGNGGVGFQGIIIIKLPYEAPQTTFNGYTYWSNINSINTTFPISLSGTKQIGLNYDGTLTMVGNSLSVASGSGSKWSQLGNNIYNNNAGNVGIGTTNPLYKLDVKGILKTDKIIIGAVSTPNVLYNLESSGDININELYRNSISLTSTLNTKQDNLSFSQPLYNTTNTIALNYDASLTKVGNNLSVVKSASLPLAISTNNWSLNYDSTLTLNGNNLSVSSASASKWAKRNSALLDDIYNLNTRNVGIGTDQPATKLDVNGGITARGDIVVNFNENDNAFFGMYNYFQGEFANVLFLFNTYSTSGRIDLYNASHATTPNLLKISNSLGDIMITNGVPDPFLYLKRSNGNIGIGTTNPQYKLDVNGNIYGRNDLYIGLSTIISSYTNASINSISGTNDKYLTYTTNGTLVLNDILNCEIFMIGGGGGGGYNHGGGGGAGAYYRGTQTLNAGSYSITIGNGGAQDNSGGNTIISLGATNILIVNGGGKGGSFNTPYTGTNGGCGGGGTGWNNNLSTNTTWAGGSAVNTGTNGTGFAGGFGRNNYYGNTINGGGGGGIGGVGVDAPIGTTGTGASGGNALNIDITGVNVVYGGGGGGGVWGDGTKTITGGLGGGVGSTYVGGQGGKTTAQAGGNGVANTGSGGGGGGPAFGAGGSGSAGIVIIRFTETGKIGIGTSIPNNKLHIEKGSVFIGDNSIGNGTQIDNNYKLIFDSSYTSDGTNKCNKIILHRNLSGITYLGGIGVEEGGIVYSTWTGARHRFYTETTNTSGGVLTFQIIKDNFNFFGNVDGMCAGFLRNASAGGSAHSVLGMVNNTGGFGGFFLNSSARSADGGANNMTLRNDVGDLILSAKSSTPQIYLHESTDTIYMNGRTNIRQGSGAGAYAVPNNHMEDGSLTIGSVNLNYGLGTGGWSTNTAGLMLECYDNTEIVVHDAGNRVSSLLSYQGGGSYNHVTIGRDMGAGWGTIWNVNIAGGSLSLANEWFIVRGTTPTGVTNSLVFLHSTATITSRWWLNGSQNGTSSEISDERIKKEIKDIDNPIEKLLLIKPKEYYLCSDKDYNKKYGIIAQDIKKEESLKHLIYTDKEYVANLLTNAKFIKEKIGEEEVVLEYPEEKYIKSESNPTPYQRAKPRVFFKYTITTEKNLNGLINIDDELKIVLDNDDIENIEIVIDDTPYNNRYKKRFVKVKEIIDDYSFEIYEDIETTQIEKDNLFIYGKKVDDFLKLDYESLYCLNIKATQELIHKNKELENRIMKLEELINKFGVV